MDETLIWSEWHRHVLFIYKLRSAMNPLYLQRLICGWKRVVKFKLINIPIGIFRVLIFVPSIKWANYYLVLAAGKVMANFNVFFEGPAFHQKLVR